MALKRLKTKNSKRQPARMKYKIQKKIRDHNKKQRREDKKNSKGKKTNKIIQIPNICPFKEEILKDVAEAKRRKEEERLQQRELMKQQRDVAKNKPASLETMVLEAEQKDAVYTVFNDAKLTTPSQPSFNDDEWRENSLKAYFKEFKKVIEAADVILEIVDARDPFGTRCAEVSKAVKASPGNKKLVLVLNKADLVPRDNLDKWLKYLRKFGPTTAFKASTQDQNRQLGRRKFRDISSKKAIQGSTCVGAELLMSMLANYSRNNGVKTAIRVGVVGIPNVGKSSIINSLKRGKACTVGSTPGVTRAMQEVELDSKIKLLDCPGIVFSQPKSDEALPSVLKNAQRVTDVKDPFTAAKSVLQRATKSYFCKLYDITEYDSPEEFFAKLSHRYGKFRKGGVPDMLYAARQVLLDWNTGKIKYCTHPPDESSDKNIHLSAQIVSHETREFEIENFDEMEAEALDNFATADMDEVVELQTTGLMQVKVDEADEKHLGKLLGGNYTRPQIIEEDEEMVGQPAKKRKAGKKEKEDPIMQIEGNQTLNKDRKVDLKKLRKMRNRNEKKMDGVADVLENFEFNLGGSEVKTKTEATTGSYDFDTDFKMV